MRPRIFVTQPIAASALERLRAVADVEVNPDGSRVPSKDVILAGARRCDILFALLHDKIDHEVIAANPKLMAVASMAITPDNIDIAEATARRIAGAALDVHEHEPQVAPELLKMSNIVATPHLGSAVAELREKMAHLVVDNILALLEGRQPPTCYNPEVLKS